MTPCGYRWKGKGETKWEGLAERAPDDEELSRCDVEPVFGLSDLPLSLQNSVHWPHRIITMENAK